MSEGERVSVFCLRSFLLNVVFGIMSEERVYIRPILFFLLNVSSAFCPKIVRISIFRFHLVIVLDIMSDHVPRLTYLTRSSISFPIYSFIVVCVISALGNFTLDSELRLVFRVALRISQTLNFLLSRLF